MNFNVWSIKEMLSIPSGSGTTKSSHWTNNQTDCSSLSDSQFLFGSQFYPENSETLPAPLDFGVHARHPKQSQQNLLDNEPSIFTKYQTKPQLFGGYRKDGALFPLPLSAGKPKGLWEQFEEEKKRAEEQCDSETIRNFTSYVRESIHKLQTSVENLEEHLSSRSQSILDSLETVAKTLQETVQAQSTLVLKAVQDGGSTEQAILEMQRSFDTTQAEFTEMRSDLKHLEVLVAQQSQVFQQLCEQLGWVNVPSVLAELKRWISERRVPGSVKDSASQTSPPPARSRRCTRKDSCAPAGPVMWQARAPPATWALGVGSVQPGALGIGEEGAQSDALQDDPVLLAHRACQGALCLKDKAVQTNRKDRAGRKTSPEHQGASVPGHKAPGDRDLVSQGPSRLTSLDLNNFATSTKNTCQKCQAKGMSLCDSCKHRLVPRQKGRSVGRRRKGRKLQPRRAHRGRKREPTPERPKPLAQPPVRPARGVTVTAQKAVTAEPGDRLQLGGHAPQDGLRSQGPQGHRRTSWLGSLTLGLAETPLRKEPRKRRLYDLGFDSSDDGF
ncbi:interactor of HORMAD1 protein 1 [Manis javanica]|uniref:interactor of HORMAD1 protein 1 n=1 Tax=Manis javanica TaxID=9974 RepID=UPI003C6D5F76